ncbi:hypothetical protein C8Q75DRAFT_257711 [Abortiporus biennis]|nr:hypothetical protein C8Q75DRAFT_257711 [Abortiporus biennis]
MRNMTSPRSTPPNETHTHPSTHSSFLFWNTMRLPLVFPFTACQCRGTGDHRKNEVRNLSAIAEAWKHETLESQRQWRIADVRAKDQYLYPTRTRLTTTKVGSRM